MDKIMHLQIYLEKTYISVCGLCLITLEPPLVDQEPPAHADLGLVTRKDNYM